MTQDHVDFIVGQWQQERPDLEIWPMAPIGRLYRLDHHVRLEINE